MDDTSFATLWAARDLFRDAILCAAIAGTALGFLGVYVVLRRMAFVSAAVTQAAGLGVALAFYAEIHLGFTMEPALAAVALSLIATLLLSLDPTRLRLPRESVLGLSFALFGGLAVIVAARITQEAHDIQSILLGSAVLVRPLDLALVGVSSACVLALHLLGWRGLTFASFDPESARVQRLPVAALDAFVLCSVGLLVGVSTRALGALPVFAFSTLPATAALLASVSVPATFVLAAVLGACSGAGGYVVAFLFDLPVGASQTVFAALLPAVALLLLGLRRLAGKRATPAP